MVRTGRTGTTYRGQRIIRCNWEEGRHQGKWYIQTYHSPTGMAWSDEECPHYDTIAQARDYIKDAIHTEHCRCEACVEGASSILEMFGYSPAEMMDRAEQEGGGNF